MDVGFILDPLTSLKAYKDSSVAMMRALAKRGHTIYALEVRDLVWSAGRTAARAVPLTLSTDDDAWHTAGHPRELALSELAAVMMRKDPPFDLEYVYATYLLEAAEREGALVYNAPRAIRDHNEKFAITRFAQFIAPTLVSADPDHVHAFIDAHEDAILKPLDGMGGASIFRVRRHDPNRNVIVEMLGQHGTRTIMAQRYIPEIADGDKRVLLIGGEVVPYALARIPKPGESRGNLAAGGRGEARPITDREREIGTALAPGLWNEGLLVVGLDVIGGFLTEVNVTSPTCFVEIAQQTGFDAAEVFAVALERAVQAGGRA
ncbi:MAG: glutathione synthase [Pseudomonadota bacterium]|nr:glutathione synthase [Pseudomonadota bacterium]